MSSELLEEPTGPTTPTSCPGSILRSMASNVKPVFCCYSSTVLRVCMIARRDRKPKTQNKKKGRTRCMSATKSCKLGCFVVLLVLSV